ncbi:flavodoxin family protein [Methanobacterium oryzae]|uniref:flavodoxin family protein n=1 Tax=Methanobacterium oryzae TaxID=69540 RepID=UPI003D1F0246
MKTAIIYKSIHHGNTKKIAKTIAGSLNADIFDLKEAKEDIIKEYDIIGFGSGIYFSKPHKKLIKFIDSLSDEKTKKAFVFSTSGKKKSEFNDLLKNKLSRKGFEVIGDFNCKGFDTWGPLKLIGGLNKGNPDEEDLINAKKFAESLKEE